MLDLYIKYWRNFAVFSGRATRKEMWAVILGNILIEVLLVCSLFAVASLCSESMTLAYINLVDAFYTVFWLAAILPTWGIVVRRLHDSDHSGWWVLIAPIPIVNLYFLYLLYFALGTHGINRYGEDPFEILN